MKTNNLKADQRCTVWFVSDHVASITKLSQPIYAEKPKTGTLASHEKTCLWGCQRGLTQIGLFNTGKIEKREPLKDLMVLLSILLCHALQKYLMLFLVYRLFFCVVFLLITGGV